MLGRACLVLAAALLIASTLSAQKVMSWEDQVFDFGHVAIDFQVFHEFPYINESDQPVQITELDVPCDCSYVVITDSTLGPGDTTFFRLSFDTKNYYGPINKSFRVFTDNPEQPEMQYFYLAIVGQWFNGLKPDPISVFLLPGQKGRIVRIPNMKFDRISLSNSSAFDSSFVVDVISHSAAKGETVEFSFETAGNAAKGTHKSNLTVHLDTGEDESVVLTIPVKTVKY